MFVKFENEKAVSCSRVDRLEDIRPDPTGFEEVDDFRGEDWKYLTKKGDNIVVDIDKKNRDTEAGKAERRHAKLKTELAKIKEDIEQEVFGLVRDDYAAKKARAAEIINELRVLEGKESREIMEVI